MLQLIRFHDIARITNNFEKYCSIVETIIDRLIASDEWDFYDLRILAGTSLCCLDVDKAETLLERTITVLDTKYKDKPFYGKAKVIFYENYVGTLLQQYCYHYEDPKLRKHIEILFEKYLENALNLTEENENYILNHSINITRKGIFYDDERLIDNGLSIVKKQGAANIHKNLIRERDDFNYFMHNSITNRPFNIKVAESLKKNRKIRNLTLEQLETHTDIPNQTLSQLERVDRMITGLQLYKLSEYYGISEREIMGLDTSYNELAENKVKTVKKIVDIASDLTDEQQNALLTVAKAMVFNFD